MSARKISWSTVSGLRHDLLHVMMFPLELKALLGEELVAGMHKYVLASLATNWKFISYYYHHSSGSVSDSGPGAWRYMESSSSMEALLACESKSTMKRINVLCPMLVSHLLVCKSFLLLLEPLYYHLPRAPSCGGFSDELMGRQAQHCLRLS